MLCKQPFQRKRSGIVHPVQVKGDNYHVDVTPFSCGQCLHCRINQSRIWQTRLLIEARYSADSTFMTLTYDDDNVPCNYYLEPDHLTKFLKRYRKRLRHKIRYFAIGEYGDINWRPHYHLAIFSEKKFERCVRSCEEMRKRDACTQDCIAHLSWMKGNISLTPTLNQDLAGYITGYIKKKATKERLINRPNEFQRQSTGRRKNGTGGIGYKGAQDIGTQLKSDPRAVKTLIRTINIAGRPRPVGGYLQNIISGSLGHKQSDIDAQFIEYSESTVSENLKKGMMIPEILRKSEGKRNSQRVKDQNFSKRRQL